VGVRSSRALSSRAKLRVTPLAFSAIIFFVSVTDESFGDFDQAVNIAIAKLRSALGDSAENPRYIETLPKGGYRFIADVSVVDADARTKRPESAAGDLHGTEPGHELQGAGLALVGREL